jgi:hypothetical protein
MKGKYFSLKLGLLSEARQMMRRERIGKRKEKRTNRTKEKKKEEG